VPDMAMVLTHLSPRLLCTSSTSFTGWPLHFVLSGQCVVNPGSSAKFNVDHRLRLELFCLFIFLPAFTCGLVIEESFSPPLVPQ